MPEQYNERKLLSPTTKWFTNLTPTFIFSSIVIFCVLFTYFKNKKITVGTLLWIIVSVMCIIIMHTYKQTTLSDLENLHIVKSNAINPKFDTLNNYPEITDFIFSIQDFYEYNPQSFENMSTAMTQFLRIYENINLDNVLAGTHYSHAVMCKKDALNALQSIILVIPPDKNMITKLDTAIKTLEDMLNKYLDIIYEKNNVFIKKNGYFNNTKLIDCTTEPYNTYTTNTGDQYY